MIGSILYIGLMDFIINVLVEILYLYNSIIENRSVDYKSIKNLENDGSI